MKKIISIILMLFITLSLSSCSLFDWITGDKEQEEQLESPIINGVDEEGEKEIIVNWTSVEDAEKYVISLNDREVVTLDNFFNICNVIKKSDTVEIKVKARAQGYEESDWSASYFYDLEYKVEGSDEDPGNSGNDENKDNNDDNGSDSDTTISIDTSLSTSYDRYGTVSSPTGKNGTLPLIDSSTDNTYNYFLIDGGYILNTPLASTNPVQYNPQLSDELIMTVSSSICNATNIEDSISKTVSESMTEIKTGSASIMLGGEFGEVNKFKLETEYSRQWGTNVEKNNSITSVHSVSNQVSETITKEITYSIKGNDKPKGDYRISIVSTCDVYYLITTSHDNMQLIGIEIVLCARPDARIVLEYSEDGKFGKTSENPQISWPKDFFKNYDIPTKELKSNVSLDVCGGETFDNDMISISMGEQKELPIPVRYGYAFVGWYSMENGLGVKYTDYTGKLYNKWTEIEDRTLYAHWTKTISTVTDVEQLRLTSRQTESEKSVDFGLGLKISELKESGYTSLKISISGACSEYDPNMKSMNRGFVLYNAATEEEIDYWVFIVKGFSGVEGKLISLDSFNDNGRYKLQLVSIKPGEILGYSPDTRLLVSSIVINIEAVK